MDVDLSYGTVCIHHLLGGHHAGSNGDVLFQACHGGWRGDVHYSGHGSHGVLECGTNHAAKGTWNLDLSRMACPRCHISGRDRVGNFTGGSQCHDSAPSPGKMGAFLCRTGTGSQITMQREADRWMKEIRRILRRNLVRPQNSRKTTPLV